MKQIIRQRLLLIWGICAFIETVCPLNVCAQNNAYKISDKLYAYFVSTNHNIKTDKGLAMTDTLMRMAVKYKDKKAQCLALTLKNLHYYAIDDIKMMIKSMKDTQRMAMATGYHQYVFDPWNRLISYYIRKRRFSEAINEIKSYQKEALKLNNEYGLLHGYKKMGDMYIMLNLPNQALEQYNKALTMHTSNLDANISDIYQSMGGVYFEFGDYKKAKHYYLLNYEHLKKTGLKTLVAKLFRAYTYEGTMTDSIEYYKNKADAEYKNNLYFGSDLSAYYAALSNYYVTKKDFKKSIEYAEKLDDENSIGVKEESYVNQGDYTNAYKCLKQIYINNKERNINSYQNMMASLLIQSDQAKLEKDKHELEMRNAKMQMEQWHSNAKLLMLQKSQTTLELKNKQLALDSKQAEISKAEEMANAEKLEILRQKEHTAFLETQNQSRYRIILLVVLLLIATVAFSTAYMIRRHILNKQLRRERDLAKEALAIADIEREKAQQADKLKSLFLQNMSHEIRTPLNAIVGFNDVLNNNAGMELPDEEKKDLVKMIRTNSDLLITIVNDILDLSKLESGSYHVVKTDVCVQDLCKTAMSSVESRMSTGVKAIMDMPNEAIHITTDAQRLQQLIMNLLTNSCKHTTEGTITLSCKIKTQGYGEAMEGHRVLEFAVSDTGPGIPAEMADKIFERFEKLDSFKQGTGLGLSICKQIASILEGEIYLDCSYHQGAKFIFLHPYQT